MEEKMSIAGVKELAGKKGYKLEQVNDFFALYKLQYGVKKTNELPYFSRSMLGMKLWLEKQPSVKEPVKKQMPTHKKPVMMRKRK